MTIAFETLHLLPSMRRSSCLLRFFRTRLVPCSALVTAVAACGSMEVSVPAAPVVTVTVTPATAGLALHGTQQLVAVTRDALGNTLSDRLVTWSSSSSVATVSSNGLVAAVEPGTATITATSEGKLATATITVISGVYGIIVGISAPVPKFFLPGMTLTMWAQANDSNHVVIPVSWNWTSSDRNIADVDQAGRVTVKTPGVARITASAGGRAASADLNVVTPQSVYAIDPSASNLLPGQQRSFRILEGPISGPQLIGSRGRWTSSDSSVARVDSNGVLSAVRPGTVTLSVVRNVGIDITLQAEAAVLSVPTPLRFLQVVAGDSFSCGRTSSETYCWGKGAIGTTARLDACSSTFSIIGAGHVQYFRQAFECAMEPMRVEAPMPFTSISALGGTACGLTADGRAYCWGATGALPTLMSESLRFANFIGQCGVTTANEGWCGGPGALGKVPGNVAWQRIDVAGSDYRCGVEVDGTYACWGENAKGQLGTGDLVASSVPVPIMSAERFTAGIGGRYYQSCALSVKGVVYCWGDSNLFPSAATTPGSSTPRAITAVEPLISLTGSPTFGFCGLSSSGLFYCGSADPIYTRMGESQSTMRFTSDASNGSLRCALAVDALLYCWGLNDSGEAGVGTQDFISNPKRVVGQ